MVGLWRVLLPQLHKAPVHENCCKSLACHFFDVRLLFHAVVWAEPQGPHMPKKLRSEAGKCRKANSKSSSTKCHEHQRNLGATAPCPASRCLESGISGPSIQKMPWHLAIGPAVIFDVWRHWRKQITENNSQKTKSHRRHYIYIYIYWGLGAEYVFWHLSYWNSANTGTPSHNIWKKLAAQPKTESSQHKAYTKNIQHVWILHEPEHEPWPLVCPVFSALDWHQNQHYVH